MPTDDIGNDIGGKVLRFILASQMLRSTFPTTGNDRDFVADPEAADKLSVFIYQQLGMTPPTE